MNNAMHTTTINRMSIEKQQEANIKLFESACYNGSAADRLALRAHAHRLVDMALDATEKQCAAIKDAMRD